MLPERLGLMSSGATQHVFLAADESYDAWVFKTPAFADELLPGNPAAAVTERWSRPAASLSRLPGARALLLRLLRRARFRAFLEMGKILTELQAAGLQDTVADFRWIPRAIVMLDSKGATLEYMGPLLQQRRVDRFFEDARDIPDFDTDSFIAAQHRLWRGGVGIADAGGAFGPDGWALLDGRLVLADTGSLTRDREHACAVLAADCLNRTRQMQLRRGGPATAPAIAAYFDIVGQAITCQALCREWNCGG